MSIGDLVFCDGYHGLILKISYGMYATEYYIYWFGYATNFNDRCCWATDRQLIKVA